MIEFATWFYGIMSFLTVMAYLPTIIVMLATKETDSSSIGWYIWWLGSIASTLYASQVVMDKGFMYASIGHFIGTSTVILIQLHKKKPLKV